MKCQISKNTKMSDLRSRSNINLIPRYADARHLEDEDNMVRFQNKEKMGCSISKKVGKTGLKVREKKIDSLIRETMKNA